MKSVDIPADAVPGMPVQTPVFKMRFHGLPRPVKHRFLNHAGIFNALHNLLMLLRLKFGDGFDQIDTQPDADIMPVIGENEAFGHGFIQIGGGFDNQRRFIHKGDAAFMVIELVKKRPAHLRKEDMAVDHANGPVQFQHWQTNQRLMMIKQRHHLLVI